MYASRRASRSIFSAILLFVFAIAFSVESFADDSDRAAQVKAAQDALDAKAKLLIENAQTALDELDDKASAKDVREAERKLAEIKSCKNDHRDFLREHGRSLAQTPSSYISLFNECVEDEGDHPGALIVTQEKEAFEAEHKSSLETCEKEEKIAAECCGNPERCFKKPDGEENENEGIFGQVLQIGLSTALTLPSNSIAGQCAKLGSVSNLVTGINMYLSVQCGKYVGQCKKACKGKIEELKNDQRCQSGSFCDDVIAKYESSLEECKTADNQSARLAAQAIAAQTSARLSKICKNLAEDETNRSGEDLFANPDCTTPGSASTPFCQALCKDASPNDARCSGFFNRDPNGGGNGFGTTSANNSGSGLFDNLVDSEEGTQFANQQDIDPTNNGTTGGGGGSGVPFAPSGGSGGGDDGGGGAGAEEGYDTGIDRGLASGNGYSTVGPNLKTGANGGFRGYGGGGKAITEKGKKFSLKDYLPGGKNNKRVQLRGLASLANDISPAHGDIFKKVTDRFHSVCLRNALYDCATLRKKKLGE